MSFCSLLFLNKDSSRLFHLASNLFYTTGSKEDEFISISDLNEGVKHLVCSEGTQAASSKTIFYKLQLSGMPGLPIPQLEVSAIIFLLKLWGSCQKVNITKCLGKFETLFEMWSSIKLFLFLPSRFIFVYAGDMSSICLYFLMGTLRKYTTYSHKTFIFKD